MSEEQLCPACRRTAGATGRSRHRGTSGRANWQTFAARRTAVSDLKEYGWLADYLTTYKAATEVGQWPKVFGETAATLRAYREGDCPGCSFRRQTGGNHDDVPTGDADPNCPYREGS